MMNENLDSRKMYIDTYKQAQNIVYESDNGILVLGSRNMDNDTLKIYVNLTVISKEGNISKPFKIDILKKDLYQECNKLIGSAGLKAIDIDKIEKEVGHNYNTYVLKLDDSFQVYEGIKYIYEHFRSEGKNIENLDHDYEIIDSILIKNGYYMVRVSKFKSIVDEFNGIYKDLKQHLINTDMLATGNGERLDPTIHIKGKKIHLMCFRIGKMKAIFDSKEGLNNE